METEAGQSLRDASPKPPFWGAKDIAPPMDKVLALMSATAIIQSRWEFKKGSLTEEQHRAVLEEKALPRLAEWKGRIESENIFQPAARYGYFPAKASGNSLNVYSPDCSETLASFDFPRQPDGRCLAVCDFFSACPNGHGLLPLFLVTLGHSVKDKIAALLAKKKYSDSFYLHGVAAEFTEACAKWLHAKMIAELGMTGGKRFGFGYPSCPELAYNGTIIELLDGRQIGVELTDAMQMDPEFSTCAMVAWHPQAEYFVV